MKTLKQLLDNDDFINEIHMSQQQADVSVTMLPPAANSAELLLTLQISTKSAVGALLYHTGGLLIADAWLRILGSGSEQLARDIVSWNDSSQGYLLVADDLLGGLFAINGGALGNDIGSLYYFAPDSTNWEALEVNFSDFVLWAMSNNLYDFYADLGIKTLLPTYRGTSTEFALHFYPPLWSQEGNINESHKTLVPISEIITEKLASGAQ